MSRWHKHEWDLLPERAFQPTGRFGKMTLEGGGGGGSQVIGYRYYFGLHMGVSRGPVDELLAIRVGEKLAWAGSVTDNANFRINAANLFGGDKGEGGISGWCAVRFGAPSQSDDFAVPTEVVGSVGGSWFTLPGEVVGLPATTLQSVTGFTQPNFRGMFTLFFDGLVTSLNPYPKAWKMRVRRVLKGWQEGTMPSWVTTYGRIIMTPNDFASLSDQFGDKYIHAMNPAAIIYECLTNKQWGRGLDVSAIDDDSFAASAQKLFEEGFGLCIKWSRKETIRSFIQSILNHCAGTLYTDRRTGKITFRLIRDDYDVATLPLFTPESGLLEVSANDVTNNAEQINEVQVKYRHAVTNETRIVRTDSLGGVMGAYGITNSTTRDFVGIPTASLAQRVAERELRGLASNIRRYTFSLDRRGYTVYPGQAIRIAHPAMDIPDTVVRVGKIEESFKEGKIKITAVQDVFGLPSETFGGSVGSTWTPPDNTPCVPFNEVFEVPYFMVARYTSASDFAYVDIASAGVGVVADKGKPLNGAYDISVKHGAPDTSENPPDSSFICPL